MTLASHVPLDGSDRYMRVLGSPKEFVLFSPALGRFFHSLAILARLIQVYVQCLVGLLFKMKGRKKHWDKAEVFFLSHT